MTRVVVRRMPSGWVIRLYHKTNNRLQIRQVFHYNPHWLKHAANTKFH